MMTRTYISIIIAMCIALVSAQKRIRIADVQVNADTFAKSLMRADSTGISRCNARPSTCSLPRLAGVACRHKCVDFCHYHDRDILFILDSSGSIDEPDYDEAKVDLAIIATHLCGHIGCNLRVAGMQFSTNPHNEFGFDEYTTPAALYNGIIAMGKEDLGTRTWLAFDFAREVMFTPSQGHRPWAKKVALIVTDGKSGSASLSIEAAQALKDSGVELFGVYIGDPGSSDFDEIRDYVSDPEWLHVFSVASVLELSNLADRIENFHDSYCHCHCHCHCCH